MKRDLVTTVPVRRGILTVAQLLGDPLLAIPVYQRPYRWSPRHVLQLLSDLELQRGRKPYRLGTVVLHEHDGCKDIVDGQQRTITLMLLVQALVRHRRDDLGELLGTQLELLRRDMARFSFASEVSQRNIQAIYLEIVRWVTRPSFNVEQADFALNHCQVVYFALDDLSEAFQFFDAQNARGRDLEPHDLLKAFHLREFHPDEEALMAETVKGWEDSATEDLVRLFGDFLFRIRSWGRRRPARHFGKEHVGLFKGVNLRGVEGHPHVAPLRLANERALQERQPFPFQLDQVVLNGRRFFEMIAHYQRQVLGRGGLRALLGRADPAAVQGMAGRILDTLDVYEGRQRTGDRYVRLLFDCLMVYYVDKFGAASLGPAVEKGFVWAYSLRLSMRNVQVAGMDNHAREGGMFAALRDAVEPLDFMHVRLSPVEQVRSTRTAALERLFRELNYLA